MRRRRRIRGAKQGRPDPKLIATALRTAAKAIARANILMAGLAREHPEVRRKLRDARDMQSRLHGMASEILHGGYGR